MNDIEKVEKFNYFEKLYFRITLGLIGLALLLFIFTMFVATKFDSIPKLLIDFTVVLLFVPAVNFFISIVRVFKYILSISRLDNNIGIVRSAFALLINPISFGILYILIIIMALSSCTVQ